MNTFHISHTKKTYLQVFGLVVATLAAAVSLTVAFSHKSEAAGTLGGELHGYAWSSTIGWISTNCLEGSIAGGSVCTVSPYAVSIDSSTGAFSGYAWSSNVGWISFNASQVTAHCASAPTIALDGTASGFAWVVNGTSASGADGCISLKSGPTGAVYGVSANPTTGVFSGFAWGSTNVGWVNFNGVTMTPTIGTPMVDIKADGLDALPMSSAGGTANLTWVSSSLDTTTSTPCTASSNWSGLKPATSTTTGTAVVVPANTSTTTPATYSYTITCTSAAGATPTTVTDTVIITVQPAAPALDFSANGVAGVTPGGVVPTVSVGYRAPINFVWTTNQMSSCTGTSGFGYAGWSGTSKIASDGTHNEIFGTISENSTFTMSCTPTIGGAPIVKTLRVVVAPPSCAVVDSSDYTSATDVFTPGDSLPSLSLSTFKLSWSGLGTSGIPTTMNITVSPPTGHPNITNTMTPSSIGTISGTTKIGLTGTMPSTPASQTVTISARSGLGYTGTPIICSSLTYKIAKPGATGGGGRVRPPWIEI
jgi:hypothetical protein